MASIQRMISLADDMLDLVLGEQFVTPMERTVKQYPYLIFYYSRVS